METQIVKVGEQIVNLTMVSSAHWEGEKLWVYLSGGRYISIKGDDAKRLWQAICGSAVDLRNAG